MMDWHGKEFIPNEIKNIYNGKNTDLLIHIHLKNQTT
jgi:hypothetical protein